MPNTIKFSDNPNEETAFVTTEDDTRTRVVLTTPVDGTVKFPDNPNSTKVSVTVDGVARKAVAVYNLGGGGGGDQHNLGWYATESALTTAHATASNGDWAIVGATDTVWVWDSDTTAWKDTDTKGQVTSVNGQTGAVTVEALPSQTGQSGKFLTTDGTDASWAAVNALQNNATNSTSIAVSETQNTTSRTVVFGSAASATNNWSTVYGATATATGAQSMSIGNGKVSGGYSIYIANSSAAQVAGQRAVVVCPRVDSGGNFNADDTIVLGSVKSLNGLSSNTFYVGLDWTNASKTFELLSADGTIPTARLTKVNTTITLAAAGWSSNTQTVSVTGVSSTSVVFVAPAPADTTDYVSAGILCTSQATNSLTFTATTTPTNDIDVNIVCL